MKKDRDIAPYPIYPPYQGMGQMPFMPMPNMINPNFMGNTCPYQNTDLSNTGINNQNTNFNNIGLNNQNNSLSILEQQVSSLEKRVSTLENIINNSNSINNNYNSSNYQIL